MVVNHFVLGTQKTLYQPRIRSRSICWLRVLFLDWSVFYRIIQVGLGPLKHGAPQFFEIRG